MNKEQKELLDKAYNKYQSQTWFHIDDLASLKESDGMNMSTGERKKVYRQYAQEEFINKCKTDTEFSEKWKLKIEERELSLEERAKWLQDNKGYDLLVGNLDHDHIREVVEEEAPTKLIAITYNDKTIESYEN
jgi:hypothetical protein